MKLDCGKTRLEKDARKGEWHRWFAWFPVRIASHDCRWLETVHRKGKRVKAFGSAQGWYLKWVWGDRVA